MKRVRGLAVILLLMFTASGFAIGAQKPVVLRAMTWDSAEGSAWAKAVFDKFEAANPNIKIELQPMPDGYDDRLLTSLAAMSLQTSSWYGTIRLLPDWED